MLIGVDAGCLGVKDKRLKVGVYQVAKNLLIGLGKLDKNNQYLLYSFYPIDKNLMQQFGPKMENVIVRPGRGWAKVWLPLRLSIDRPQFFLALNQYAPKILPFSPRPFIIGFVYDLAFEINPEMYPGLYKRLSVNTGNLVKNSDYILSISESTKKDLINIYGVDSSKIRVCSLGCSDNFSSKGEKYKQENPYFLFVGTLKISKNIPGIIRGFYYFLERTKLDYSLILAGGDNQLDPKIRDVINTIPKNIREKIKLLGYVNDDLLAKLYRGATAFVSPSFYEGFGIPLLEAMNCGCPVIVSDVGSIKEVVDRAGIFIDPNDYKSIGNAIIKITKNNLFRKKCVNLGLKQAAKFSWENFSKDIYSIVEKNK